MQKKTWDRILKLTILFSVMTAGYQISSVSDPVQSIAYARSVYKTTQSINMRSGRSFSRSVVTKIPADRAVDVIEVYDGGAWAKIRWNGSTGYIHTMYLKLTSVEDPPAKTGSATIKSGTSYQADGYHMYASSKLTLRKNPSASSASLGSVAAGDDLLLINKKGDWFQVRHKGRYGWLPTKYVKDYAAGGTASRNSSSNNSSSSNSSSGGSSSSSRQAAGNSPSGTSYQADGYHMYASSKLTLRKKPSASSASLGSVAAGDDLLLINKSGSWFQIRHKGRYGWLPTRYVKDYTAGGTAGSSSSGSSSSGSSQGGRSYQADGYHMVTKSSVNLRSAASSSSRRLDTLKGGTDVLLINASGNWFKVYVHGRYGYLHKNYVRDYTARDSSGSGSTGGSGSGSSSGSGSGVSPSGKKPSAATRSDLVRIETAASYSDRDITVNGTVKNTSVSRVEIYLNGTYLDRAAISGSGYRYTIPSQVLRPGKNELRVEAETGKGRLYQSRSFQVNKVPTVVIDPGHGGSDPGAIGQHKGKEYYEKDYTIKFAANLKKELEKLGFRVIMTRSGDRWVDNSDRVRIAREYDADLLFAMHHNAVRNSTSSGGLSIYPSMKYSPSTQASFTESRDLAEMLASAYERSGMDYRGAYRDIDISGHTLYIMRNAPMRTILTEMGFISSSRDINQIKDPLFQTNLPRELARQIHRFFFSGR